MSTLQVNTINESTSGSGVTVDGLKIKDVTSGSVMSKPILQVVIATTTTDTGNLAVTSFTDTGLSGSITPSSTSSKIMVFVSQTLNAERNSGDMQGIVNIVRDSTEVGEWYYKASSGMIGPFHVALSFVDSPSTTSSVTYKTQIKGNTTADGAKVRANQQSASGESTSTMHLIEIAG